LSRTATRPARAAVVGVGHSKVYRRAEPGASIGRLAVEACRQAIEDAGLTPADVDGVCCDPFQPFMGAGEVDGVHTVRPDYVISALGLDVCWHESVSGSTPRVVIEAVNAVASGNCKAVLAFRALHNPEGRYGRTNPAAASGQQQFTAPYGLYPPAMYAHLWTRYMHEHGTTREQMAPFIVHNRKMALLWEHGYWYQHRPEELTEQDYVDDRIISSPIGMLDCDLPVQACGAFLVTSAELATEGPHRPAYVRGWAVPGDLGFYPHMRELDVMRERGERFARHLFSNAGVSPSDVDVANVYDGFSIFVPLYLETLGFCKDGEAFDFMTPERIGIDGELPLNTSSGNLGSGRMHGVPQFLESVLQIQGRSGPRQVDGAEIALAVAGGQPGAAAGAVFSATPD
jgi:acetyl-CoA acetyltransferase